MPGSRRSPWRSGHVGVNKPRGDYRAEVSQSTIAGRAVGRRDSRPRGDGTSTAQRRQEIIGEAMASMRNTGDARRCDVHATTHGDAQRQPQQVAVDSCAGLRAHGLFLERLVLVRWCLGLCHVEPARIECGTRKNGHDQQHGSLQQYPCEKRHAWPCVSCLKRLSCFSAHHENHGVSGSICGAGVNKAIDTKALYLYDELSHKSIRAGRREGPRAGERS